MLSVEDWAEIRRLHRAEGLPIKAIVRVLGISRNTVRAAIASDGPPKYQPTSAGSIVDDVEPRIRELLQSYPRMPATVIAERNGWERGLTVLKERIAELRPVYPPPDRGGGGRATWPGRSPSAICGFRRSSCRSGLGRSVVPALLPVAGREGRAHRTVPSLPRDAGREGGGLQTRQPRSQGSHRTLSRSRGAFVFAGTLVHLTDRLQYTTAAVDLGSEQITADRQAMLTLPPGLPGDRVAIGDPVGSRPITERCTE